jgi:hypothetical protein
MSAIGESRHTAARLNTKGIVPNPAPATRKPKARSCAGLLCLRATRWMTTFVCKLSEQGRSRPATRKTVRSRVRDRIFRVRCSLRTRPVNATRVLLNVLVQVDKMLHSGNPQRSPLPHFPLWRRFPRFNNRSMANAHRPENSI